MIKRINSSTGNFEEQVTDTLVLDTVPTVNSFNTVTSDGVARAIAGASGEVPQVTENDNGKVLTAIYDAGGPAVEWSTKGQVPSSTSEDSGKVLTVDPTGTPAWGEPSVGQDIPFYDSSGFWAYPDYSSIGLKVSPYWGNKLELRGDNHRYNRFVMVNSSLMRIYCPAAYYASRNKFYLTFGYGETEYTCIPEGYKAAWCQDVAKTRYYIVESGATLPRHPTDSGGSTIYYLVPKQTISYVRGGTCTIPMPPSIRPDYVPDPAKYTKVGDWSSVAEDVDTWLLGFVNPSTGTWLELPTETINGYTYARCGAIVRYSLYVGPELPEFTSADAGKVLQVQNDGTLAWVTLP